MILRHKSWNFAGKVTSRLQQPIHSSHFILSLFWQEEKGQVDLGGIWAQRITGRNAAKQLTTLPTHRFCGESDMLISFYDVKACSNPSLNEEKNIKLGLDLNNEMIYYSVLSPYYDTTYFYQPTSIFYVFYQLVRNSCQIPFRLLFTVLKT